MSSNIRNKNMGQMSWQHSTPNYNKDNWRYVDQLTVDIATTNTTQTSASHQHRINATGWYRIRVGGSIAMIALISESPVIIIIIPGYAASRIWYMHAAAGTEISAGRENSTGRHACVQQDWSSSNMQAGITMQFTEFCKIVYSSDFRSCMHVVGWLAGWL